MKKLWRSGLLAALVAGLVGCGTITDWWGQHKPQPQPAENLPALAQAWPAIAAPRFLEHGYPGEDADRESKLAAACAAGLDCLEVDAAPAWGATDEFIIHVLYFEHPQRPGYHNESSNWFCLAERWGVRRWQHRLGVISQAQAQQWRRWTCDKGYANRLQYLVCSNTAPAVLTWLRKAAASNNVEVVLTP